MEAKEQCPLKSAAWHRGTDLSPVGDATVLAPQKAIALVSAFRQPLASLLVPYKVRWCRCHMHHLALKQLLLLLPLPWLLLLLEPMGLRGAEPPPVLQPVL